MAQFNLQPQALHGPGILGNLTNNNPIPACTLCKLAYIQMASTMTDEIAALTEDAHGPWACFFMAIKDDLENYHLYNATGSLCPIPDKAFYPTPATLALQYYLSATGVLTVTTLSIGDGSTMSDACTGSPVCQPITFCNNQRLVDQAQPRVYIHWCFLKSSPPEVTHYDLLTNHSVHNVGLQNDHNMSRKSLKWMVKNV
ncbi:hypothetical protein V8B97DRAFT_1917425 [Scleroderma yunnanense]